MTYLAIKHKAISSHVQCCGRILLLIGLTLFCLSPVWAAESSIKADVDKFISKVLKKVGQHQGRITVLLEGPAKAKETNLTAEFTRYATDAITNDSRLELVASKDLPKDVILQYSEKESRLTIRAVRAGDYKPIVEGAIPPFPWWQRLFKHLQKLISGAIVTVLTALFVLAIYRLWSQISGFFWKVVRRLGTLPGLRKLAIKAYLNSVREEFGEVTNIYLDRKETLDLHRVFVPLGLRTLDDRAGDHLTPRSTREILTDSEERRLVILGGPGSGKTTMLKALASGVSRRQWVEYRDLIPIVVVLRGYAREADLPELHDWLIQTVLPSHGMRNAEAILRSLMNEGRALLLLDGLDEVTEDKLPTVIERIADFLENWDTGSKAKQGCRVFLTCREQNFNLLPDQNAFRREDFREYRLKEMRESEVETMVHSRWELFEEEKQEKGKPEADEKKSPEAFLRAIYANPSIAQLHRNPLLLTLSIGLYVHRIDDVVPHDLATFYEESIDHLLRRRRHSNTFDATDKYHLLQKFALRRMEETTQEGKDFEDFQVAELIREAEEMARDRLSIEVDEAEALVAEIHERAGLINDLGDREHFTFAHRSLHEFCAAHQLANLAEDGLDQLSARLGHPAWRQTIIFYCSIDHRHADALIEMLLVQAKEMGTQGEMVARLSLAGECAAVLAKPRVPLRLQVAETLIATIQQLADDDENRRVLLIPLFSLGRDAPTEVRERVEKTLRNLIDLEDPENFARELPRLEKSAALSLLDFMISVGNPEYQKAALVGLSELEGLEKISRLWRLLELFVRQDDEAAAAAGTQLMELMELEDAVAQLDSQQTRLGAVVEDEEARNAYPFGPEEAPPSNFARLLALEARARSNAAPVENWLVQGEAWLSFLNAAVSSRSTNPKQAEEMTRRWRNLPRDRHSRVWRIRWQTLGRCLCVTALLAGIVMGALFVERYHEDNLTSVITGSVVSVIILTDILWQPWRWTARRFSWLKDYGAAPHRLVVHLARMLPHGRGKGRISSFVSLGRLGVRFLYFSLATLLLPLALFLTNPRWTGHGSAVQSATFNADETRILTSSSDGIARLWDVDSGNEILRLTHDGSVYSVAFNSDETRIFTTSDDNTARLWDAESGQMIHRFTHDGRVNSAVFNADETRILTSSSDGIARLWDVDSGQMIHRSTHDGPVYGAVFNSDETRILTGSRGLTVYLWKGSIILTGAGNQTIRLWDVDSGQMIHRFTHDGRVNSAVFNADETRILTSSYDRTAHLWDADSGQMIHRFTHNGPVYSATFNSDETRILTSSDDNTARLWDAESGKTIHHFPHDSLVYSAVFNSDETRILTSSGNRTAHLWDAESGNEIHRFDHDDGVGSAVFNSDETRILTSSSDGTARLWDVDSGGMIHRFPRDGRVNSATFNSDGNRILTTSEDDTARLWDAKTGQLLWVTPRPFWNPHTWGWDDVILGAFLIFLFFFLPTIRLFDRDRFLVLRSPNPYLRLYDLPGIERWLPPEQTADAGHLIEKEGKSTASG